jgi:hypothetical protein
VSDVRAKVVTLADVKIDPSALIASEKAFQRGADHAVAFLAERLHGVRSAKEMRSIVEAYSIAINNARCAFHRKHFDLRSLLFKSTGES